jgi:hypothetical protein
MKSVAARTRATSEDREEEALHGHLMERFVER